MNTKLHHKTFTLHEHREIFQEAPRNTPEDAPQSAPENASDSVDTNVKKRVRLAGDASQRQQRLVEHTQETLAILKGEDSDEEEESPQTLDEESVDNIAKIFDQLSQSYDGAVPSQDMQGKGIDEVLNNLNTADPRLRDSANLTRQLLKSFDDAIVKNPDSADKLQSAKEKFINAVILEIDDIVHPAPLTKVLEFLPGETDELVDKANKALEGTEEMSDREKHLKVANVMVVYGVSVNEKTMKATPPANKFEYWMNRLGGALFFLQPVDKTGENKTEIKDGKNGEGKDPDKPSTAETRDQLAMTEKIKKDGLSKVKDPILKDEKDAKIALDGDKTVVPVKEGLRDQRIELQQKEVTLNAEIEQLEKETKQQLAPAVLEVKKTNLQNKITEREKLRVDITQKTEKITEQEGKLAKAKSELDTIKKIEDAANAKKDKINESFVDMKKRLNVIQFKGITDAKKTIDAINTLNLASVDQKLQMVLSSKDVDTLNGNDDVLRKYSLDVSTTLTADNGKIQSVDNFMKTMATLVQKMEDQNTQEAEMVEKGAPGDLAKEAAALNALYDGLNMKFEGGQMVLKQDLATDVLVQKLFIGKYDTLSIPMKNILAHHINTACNDLKTTRGEALFKLVYGKMKDPQYSNPAFLDQVIALAKDGGDLKMITGSTDPKNATFELTCNKTMVRNSNMYKKGLDRALKDLLDV